MSGTVVEVTEVLVEPPLVDGTPAHVKRIAICSTFEQAATCARQRITERSGESGGIVYYVLDMVILDRARQTVPTAIFGRDDKLRGMIPGDIEKPWQGRRPEDCKYRLGDLVAFVTDAYRVGVIMGLPPSPEEARQWSDVTVGDNAYLVGLIDRDDPFSADCFDHEHLPEPLLFDPPPDVPQELREALRHRCLGREGFPPWTAQEQQRRRDPDAVISRALARYYHDEDVRQEPAGTRATLVVDKSVCFLANSLKDANFQVVDLADADFETRKKFLAHRMVVTQTTPEFLDDASVLDLGIIGLDALPILHAETSYADNTTAQMISKAVSDYSLSSERSGWVLMLHPSGKHVFRRIE